MQSQTHRSIRALTEGAILMAVTKILCFLPLYKFPWGGSVSLAMLPIILFCIRWGFGPGMVMAVAHAVLETLFEGGGAISWQSIVGDYMLAFSVLGVAGLFKGKFCLGAIVACSLRFLVHYVVGATIWAEFMPERFFGMTMTSPWFYSALYNGAYMVPSLIITLIAYWLLKKTPAARYFKSEV